MCTALLIITSCERYFKKTPFPIPEIRIALCSQYIYRRREHCGTRAETFSLRGICIREVFYQWKRHTWGLKIVLIIGGVHICKMGGLTELISTYVDPQDTQPAGLPEKPGCSEYPKSCILRMLVRNFLCNVNNTRALIGLCLLVTSL